MQPGRALMDEAKQGLANVLDSRMRYAEAEDVDREILVTRSSLQHRSCHLQRSLNPERRP